MEKRKARVRAVMECGVMAEGWFEKEVAQLRMQFPQVPQRILERMVGSEELDMTQVPVNRRRRRTIAQAKRIIINMFSGGAEDRWRHLEKDGTVVLCVDTLLGINVLHPHVLRWITTLVDSGKVVLWMSGPPCRSVSFCRSRAHKDHGPPVLRTREGPQRFGKQGLTGPQQELADHDAALWLLNLWWLRKVRRSSPRAELLIEQPADPSTWASNAEEAPTFLCWPETVGVVEELDLEHVQFNQGLLGHSTTKPTSLLSSVGETMGTEGHGGA